MHGVRYLYEGCSTCSLAASLPSYKFNIPIFFVREMAVSLAGGPPLVNMLSYHPTSLSSFLFPFSPPSFPPPSLLLPFSLLSSTSPSFLSPSFLSPSFSPLLSPPLPHIQRELWISQKWLGVMPSLSWPPSTSKLIRLTNHSCYWERQARQEIVHWISS